MSEVNRLAPAWGMHGLRFEGDEWGKWCGQVGLFVSLVDISGYRWWPRWWSLVAQKNGLGSVL